MLGMFGDNRDRNTRIIGIIIGVVVIVSMIMGSFALTI
jgi:hypothetical protein